MSNNENPVLLTIDGHIARIRFNRPECLNAVDVGTSQGLLKAATEISQAEDVRVIILTGEGRSFMAGGDLAFFREAGPAAPDAAHAVISPMHQGLKLLAALPQPIISAVQGPLAGAGMSIALFADFVIAADNAVFNSAYINVANNPDCSGSWVLPRLVGMRKAMEIMLLSDNIDATQALELSLVNQVVPLEQLSEAADKLAAKISKKAPLAVQSLKALVRGSFEHTLDQQLDLEEEKFAKNAGSADFLEALEAFFGKRKPEFTGK
ncbi:enoyl-CoA hydratase/isomerase family protein [Halioxenophilus sp. WMMB6]|uniref:enoyl-CoA hydratase/isomerase family protein n=1 Tax=Halioxenophilus sp. WMMB6 TaxID=3073815 RepID=UPI00295F4A9F|nr:enoyl-CoA hydratase-related protein [Halioxenophilus sp. WMMB6]